MSTSVVCSLFVHHMFPDPSCHLHAQDLSSHGGRLLLFHGWVSGESDPCARHWCSGCTYGFSAQGHLGLLLLRRRLARRSMVHPVRRAQEHGAGQGIRLNLMARSLAPRSVTTCGHLDAVAIVSLFRHCNSAWGSQRGVVSILVYQIAPQHGKGNSAQPCVHVLSLSGNHQETMNKESPHVYLNG